MFVSSLRNLINCFGSASKRRVICAYLGAILCAIGFTSAIIVGLLDKVGVQQLGQAESLQQDSKKVVCINILICDIKELAICIVVN